MKRSLLKYIPILLMLFIGLQGIAQQLDFRLATMASYPAFKYSDETQPKRVDDLVNDISVSVFMAMDSSIYLGLALGTLDYNDSRLTQGNLALDLILEKRLLQKEGIDFGLYLKQATVKNLTDNLTQDINSSWRVGFGVGGNVRYKITKVLGMMLQYSYHKDLYAQVKTDHLAIKGKRHGVSIGMTYSYH